KLYSIYYLAGVAGLSVLTFILLVSLLPSQPTTMSLHCEACLKTISPDGRHMKWSVCAKVYHLGKTCSGIADSTFHAMSPDKKEKWRCKACRPKSNRAGLDGADVSSDEILTSEPTPLAVQILTINQKLDSLLSLKDSVNSLLELPAKVNELLLLKPSIDLMKASVAEVQTSISSLTAEYNRILATVSVHATVIHDLREEVGDLKTTVSDQANIIQSLQTEMNNAEQRSRLQIMEIRGLSVTPDDALPDVLAGLTAKLKIEGHQPSDVVSIYRLQGKDAVCPPILVKFATVAAKDRWMQARGKLRLLSRSSPPEKLYFNESLTQSNRELFWLARSRARERGYTFVWVKNARIFARKEEGTPLVRILQRSDLDLIT
ncbi:unnamed protein product, partial [Ixodes hexagonus]